MVELIASNAYRKLNELSIGSKKINAAVCYWTMQPHEFGKEFLSALCHKDTLIGFELDNFPQISIKVRFLLGDSMLSEIEPAMTVRDVAKFLSVDEKTL